MDQQDREDLIAELVALNLALTKAFAVIHQLSDLTGMDSKRHIEGLLDAGDRDLGSFNFMWNVPENRKSIVLENARFRYAETIAALSRR